MHIAQLTRCFYAVAELLVTSEVVIASFCRVIFKEWYLKNIIYFQVKGTPLRSGDYCYVSTWCNYNVNLVCDSRGHLRSNKSFMTMETF